MDHLSYSSISLYLSCPEAWRRKYIVNEITVATPALVFGSAIHATIEKHITGQGELLALWPAEWSKVLENGPVQWGIDTPEQHFNEGVRILNDANVQYNLAAIRPAEDENGPMIECKVELRVPGVPIPIIGYIDVIAQDSIPGDFKTSKQSWNSSKAAGELQPLFYLAALNQAGKTVPDWRFRHYTLVKTRTPKFETFESKRNPAECFFLFQMIGQVWRAIEREVFPPNPTGWKCDPAYCDFYANCRGKYL
jgi:hypothetical protein